MSALGTVGLREVTGNSQAVQDQQWGLPLTVTQLVTHTSVRIALPHFPAYGKEALLKYRFAHE